MKRIFFPAFLVLCSGGLLLGFVFFASFIIFASDLPRPENLVHRRSLESSKIYDRTGSVLLYEIHGDTRREYKPLEAVSSSFLQAVIAAEDRNFFDHFGIDPRAMIRAVLTNLRLRELSGGASTISQQFIRNSLLTKEKTITRKFKEIILTIELEKRYSKSEILEFYVNEVSFGSNVRGVEAASRFYFSKSAKDLSLGEGAVLAAVLKAPSLLSPFGDNQQRLFVRKDYIVEEMRTAGIISDLEYWRTKRSATAFRKTSEPIKAPHFVLFVKKYLEDAYGPDFLLQGGLSIYTTLDWELQQLAEEKIREATDRNKSFQAANAALVSIHAPSGEILTMVGSKDWFGASSPNNCTSGVNCVFDPKPNVVTAKPGRQPGSAIKPVVYAAAFQKGYTPETVVVDEETNFGVFNGKLYIPQNYDEKFRGPVTLRSALAQSLNVPSVKVLGFVGVSEAIRTAKDFGLTTLRDPSFYGLSFVLGGGEVTLLELAGAYEVFATEGFRVSPTSIKKITDSSNTVLFVHSPAPQRIIPPTIARAITSILSDNNARAPIFGLHSLLDIDGVAAKTGTTQDYRDAWTIGYTPSFVVGVWVGNNDNSPMDKKPGAMLAAPVWNSFFRELLQLYPKEYRQVYPTPKKQ